MSDVADEGKQPDWDKARDVALALLFLSRSHRGGHRRRTVEIPFLEDFEEEGWIGDSNTALGWVELTDSGWDRARAMLEKRFGIMVDE